MPVVIRKIPNQNAYKVIDVANGRVHATHTTLKRAQAQKRLLDQIWRQKRKRS